MTLERSLYVILVHSLRHFWIRYFSDFVSWPHPYVCDFCTRRVSSNLLFCMENPSIIHKCYSHMFLSFFFLWFLVLFYLFVCLFFWGCVCDCIPLAYIPAHTMLSVQKWSNVWTKIIDPWEITLCHFGPLFATLLNTSKILSGYCFLTPSLWRGGGVGVTIIRKCYSHVSDHLRNAH